MVFTMKTLAFAMALAIATTGAMGILVPGSLVWIADHVANSLAFIVIGAIRIAFGLILFSVASASRAPRTLRVLGAVVLIAGISTILTAFLAMPSARNMIESWTHQGNTLCRLSGIVILALGSFIAYACAPVRGTTHAAGNS